MKQKAITLLALLLITVQYMWAWDGSGTQTDPYKIKNHADWKQLADDVLGGNSYRDKYFKMTADLDAQGTSVGRSDRPFSGVFDGGGHTMTYNRGSENDYVDDHCAPFVRLDGALIRHLNV